MKVIYSFNKTGWELEYWSREIRAASSEQCEFIAFNHGKYVNPWRYSRAQLLDDLYSKRDPDLLKTYAELCEAIVSHRADALVVDNFPPYHPDFLVDLNVYKVLRLSDGPIAAYDRDFAYLSAYDHVLYHSPAHSPRFTMAEKLGFLGVKRATFLPHALFDAAFDPRISKDELLSARRDIDIIFIGAFHVGKMPFLAKLKKYFGRRLLLRGLIDFRKNVYFNVKYGVPGIIKPVAFQEYIPLYRRSKIGVNLHNRGKYGIGNYRLFELPANGVFQISDGGKFLSDFFDVGSEIVGYDGLEDLIAKIEYYLCHEAERNEISAAAYDAVLLRHRFKSRMGELASAISPFVPSPHFGSGEGLY